MQKNIFLKTPETLSSNVVNLCNPDGTCSRCGNCCSDLIPLLPSDIKRIRCHLKTHPMEPVLHGYHEAQTEYLVDLMCPFLNDETHACDIYDVRPAICRTYLCKTHCEQTQDKNEPDAITTDMLKAIEGTTETPDDLKIQSMQQTFFPRAWLPHIGDMVVLNPWNQNQKQIGRRYMVVSINLSKGYAHIRNNHEECRNYPLIGLTRVHTTEYAQNKKDSPVD